MYPFQNSGFLVLSFFLLLSRLNNIWVHGFIWSRPSKPAVASSNLIKPTSLLSIFGYTVKHKGQHNYSN